LISSLGNSFVVLGVMSVLAGGYIVYDAPICRLLWPGRQVGYVLYFRIITAGLILLLLSYALLMILPAVDSSFQNLSPETALFLVLPFAFALRIAAAAITYCGYQVSSGWRHKLKLKELDGKGFEQFILEKINRQEMVLITLESNKVYAGWPLEIPDSENKKWLRFVPQWSGLRGENATIDIKIDYSKVFTPAQLTNNRMLIQVEKIVTLQPFDIQIFRQFNSESNSD